jgi:hypothetical protein
MLKCLHRSESLANVFLNQVLQEFLRLLGVPLKGLMVKVKIAFNHIADDFEFRVAWEGHFAR